MIDRDDIARAARNLDALAEEIGREGTLHHHGVDRAGVDYVAAQRALRMGLVIDGRSPNQPRPMLVQLSPAVRALLPALQAVWVDGFLAGLLARHNSSSDIPGIAHTGRMNCTTSDCEREADRVVAWRLATRQLFVAPYCEEHASDLEVDQGAMPASVRMT